MLIITGKYYTCHLCSKCNNSNINLSNKSKIIVGVSICAVAACMGVEQELDMGNLPSVVTNIIFIVLSLVFRYGATLEQKKISKNN